ncbi:uncharacterized protein LOC109709059 [Ananas comosus]|uniref:Uncharacterized protein LOC109709059 n=1 Tax=Ananas comosus TaxID=4615 RepID=A0A6P5ET44_ANACO|nr:uncharacterized protein LOC109709059 [Ananas comosus]
MAHDLLTVQISTVASESAFSAGGRILDDYKIRLKKDAVERVTDTPLIFLLLSYGFSVAPPLFSSSSSCLQERIATSVRRRRLRGNYACLSFECSSLPGRRNSFFDPNRWAIRSSQSPPERWCFFGGDGLEKDAILLRRRRRRRGRRRKGRLVLVRANNFNGGGGGWDKNTTARVLGNLALAVGLTYLTMTGQLGWLLDAIVSIWLVAVLLPIVGLGAFFWFAGRDIVQSSCPNCGNDFQILKSFLNDGPQLCPFCSQPFSVQGDKFVRESAKFSSDRSATYRQAFNEYSPRVEKGKATSATVVDIEADVKDIE